MCQRGQRRNMGRSEDDEPPTRRARLEITSGEDEAVVPSMEATRAIHHREDDEGYPESPSYGEYGQWMESMTDFNFRSDSDHLDLSMREDADAEDADKETDSNPHRNSDHDDAAVEGIPPEAASDDADLNQILYENFEGYEEY